MTPYLDFARKLKRYVSANYTPNMSDSAYWLAFLEHNHFGSDRLLYDAYKKCIDKSQHVKLVNLRGNKLRTKSEISRTLGLEYNRDKKLRYAAALYAIAYAIGTCKEQDFIDNVGELSRGAAPVTFAAPMPGYYSDDEEEEEEEPEVKILNITITVEDDEEEENGPIDEKEAARRRIRNAIPPLDKPGDNKHPAQPTDQFRSSRGEPLAPTNPGPLLTKKQAWTRIIILTLACLAILTGTGFLIYRSWNRISARHHTENLLRVTTTPILAAKMYIIG